jgi:hypothetical protein
MKALLQANYDLVLPKRGRALRNNLMKPLTYMKKMFDFEGIYYWPCLTGVGNFDLGNFHREISFCELFRETFLSVVQPSAFSTKEEKVKRVVLHKLKDITSVKTEMAQTSQLHRQIEREIENIDVEYVAEKGVLALNGEILTPKATPAPVKVPVPKATPQQIPKEKDPTPVPIAKPSGIIQDKKCNSSTLPIKACPSPAVVGKISDLSSASLKRAALTSERASSKNSKLGKAFPIKEMLSSSESEDD